MRDRTIEWLVRHEVPILLFLRIPSPEHAKRYTQMYFAQLTTIALFMSVCLRLVQLRSAALTLAIFGAYHLVCYVLIKRKSAIAKRECALLLPSAVAAPLIWPLTLDAPPMIGLILGLAAVPQAVLVIWFGKKCIAALPPEHGDGLDMV